MSSTSIMILKEKLRRAYIEILSEIKDITLFHKRDENDITLLFATKKQPGQIVLTLYELGIRIFGESTIQEAEKKFYTPLLMSCHGIELHFIGILQKNKIKKALSLFDCIQSIGSIELAEELLDVYYLLLSPPKTKSIFLQVNLTPEIRQYGFENFAELKEAAKLIHSTNTLKIRGLMCIGPNTKNIKHIASCFRQASIWAEELTKALNLPFPLETSMGMSNDFHIAIQEGASMLRIGTSLFGRKNI